MGRSWHLIGQSVRGASHDRSNVENQDAIKWTPDDGQQTRVALSVSDGHGSARCFRSSTGSRIAVDVACALSEDLLKIHPLDDAKLGFIKARLERDAPRALVQEWEREV